MSDDSPATTATPSLDELRAEAIAWGRRSRARGSWYAAEHMVRAMRAYGWTIIVGAFAQPVLYLLGLGFGLAALIDAPIAVDGGSVPYLVFVAPALLMTAAITVASEEFSYPVVAGFKWRRYFYGFHAAPLAPAQIANGVVIGATARMLVAAVAYYVFIAVFGAVPQPLPGATAILIGALGGLAFGTPLMAYAASVRQDKGQFALVQRFIFIPMFLFSGTFYPLTNLPAWMQPIGWVSPLWHATEAGRIVSYGSGADVPALLAHLAYLTLIAAGGYVVARRIFHGRLTE